MNPQNAESIRDEIFQVIKSMNQAWLTSDFKPGKSLIINLSLDEVVVLNRTKIHILPFYKILESDFP